MRHASIDVVATDTQVGRHVVALLCGRGCKELHTVGIPHGVALLVVTIEVDLPDLAVGCLRTAGVGIGHDDVTILGQRQAVVGS